MKKATLYYDGDCPFCNRYSKLQEIRQCVDLSLKNAREDLRYKEIDPNLKLDDGVILIDQNNTIHQGVDAINYLDSICKFKGMIFGVKRSVKLCINL